MESTAVDNVVYTGNNGIFPYLRAGEPAAPSSHPCGLLCSSVRGYETQAESHRCMEQRTSDAETLASCRRCRSVRWAYLARFLAILADFSDSVGLVPVFKFQEPRGSGVGEALVVWSLGGEKPLHSSTPASLVRRAIA